MRRRPTVRTFSPRHGVVPRTGSVPIPSEASREASLEWLTGCMHQPEAVAPGNRDGPRRRVFPRPDGAGPASGAQPLRLVCWPLFNGAESSYFYPGGGDASTLSTITEPLRKYANLVRSSGREHLGIGEPLRHPQHVQRGQRLQLHLARPDGEVGRSADRRPHRKDLADPGQVAAPGGHPGRFAQRLPAGAVDGVLRAASRSTTRPTRSPPSTGCSRAGPAADGRPRRRGRPHRRLRWI